MSFVRDFLRPGDSFVDVGANVGSYSLLAAGTTDVTILAFEPSSLAYGRLLENVELNGLESRLSASQVAIGAESGEAMISTGQDAVNHVLSPDEAVAHEVIPMRSLDEVMATGDIRTVNLVKVDVEGMEEQVLRGAIGLLGSASPVLIVEANDVAAIRDLLEPLGYKAVSYDPSRRQVADIDWFDIRENNILAVRNRALVEGRLASIRAFASEPGVPTGRRDATPAPRLDLTDREALQSPPPTTPPYLSPRDPIPVRPVDTDSPAASASQGRSAAGMGRRISWMVVDQGLSSLSNVATSIVAARALSPRDFGAFGLAFVVYSLVLGITRGAITEPLVSLFSHDAPGSLHRTLRAAAGSAVDLGLIMTIGVAAVAALVGGVTWIALGALALVLPGLLLQDAWRYCFVTSGRPRAAVFNDGLWCLIQAGVLVVLLQTGHLTLLSLVLWWGGSGVAAGLVGCVQAAMVPRLWSARQWIKAHRQLSWRYATEYAVATGTGQVALLLLGAIAGLAALGAVRGALVFFGPIVVLYTGAFLAIAAEGVRLRTQPVKLRHLMEYSSCVLVVVAVFSLLIGVALPNHLGKEFFGATWVPERRVIVPLGLAVLANCAAAGAVIGLRALAAAKASLRARLITAPVTAIGPVVGAAWGARGFAVGLAAASWLGALVWWRQFRRALAEDARTGVVELAAPNGL